MIIEAELHPIVKFPAKISSQDCPNQDKYEIYQTETTLGRYQFTTRRKKMPEKKMLLIIFTVLVILTGSITQSIESVDRRAWVTNSPRIKKLRRHRHRRPSYPGGEDMDVTVELVGPSQRSESNIKMDARDLKNVFKNFKKCPKCKKVTGIFG